MKSIDAIVAPHIGAYRLNVFPVFKNSHTYLVKTWLYKGICDKLLKRQPRSEHMWAMGAVGEGCNALLDGFLHERFDSRRPEDFLNLVVFRGVFSKFRSSGLYVLGAYVAKMDVEALQRTVDETLASPLGLDSYCFDNPRRCEKASEHWLGQLEFVWRHGFFNVTTSTNTYCARSTALREDLEAFSEVHARRFIGPNNTALQLHGATHNNKNSAVLRLPPPPAYAVNTGATSSKARGVVCDASCAARLRYLYPVDSALLGTFPAPTERPPTCEDVVASVPSAAAAGCGVYVSERRGFVYLKAARFSYAAGAAPDAHDDPFADVLAAALLGDDGAACAADANCSCSSLLERRGEWAPLHWNATLADSPPPSSSSPNWRVLSFVQDPAHRFSALWNPAAHHRACPPARRALSATQAKEANRGHANRPPQPAAKKKTTTPPKPSEPSKQSKAPPRRRAREKKKPPCTLSDFASAVFAKYKFALKLDPAHYRKEQSWCFLATGLHRRLGFVGRFAPSFFVADAVAALGFIGVSNLASPHDVHPPPSPGRDALQACERDHPGCDEAVRRAVAAKNAPVDSLLFAVH